MPTGDRLIRIFLNLWTFFVLPFVVLNFFYHDRFEHLAVPTAVLYTGLLALYVGTKEFERWYEMHHERHPGERFVILWTVVIGTLFLISMVLGPEYAIHSDLVATYIAVLTLYAFTHKSKELHRRKVALDRQQAVIEAAKHSV
jgi:hypothetical protein